MNYLFNSLLSSFLWLAATAVAQEPPALMDTMVFGDRSVEQSHQFSGATSETISGGLGEPARRLLPLQPADWRGGSMAFTMKIDPVRPNYATIRLWGSDVSTDRLILFCEGRQVGYIHIGDIDLLDFGNDGNEPPDNGRFYYATTPLPLAMTQGKTELHCEIRSIGAVWAYGPSFNQFQKTMTLPTRGIYKMYTHTDGYFIPPAEEVQGRASANPPVRAEQSPHRPVPHHARHARVRSRPYVPEYAAPAAR